MTETFISSTKMEAVTCTHLSNKAVDQYQTGDYSRALATFTKALTLFQSQAGQYANVRTTSPDDSLKCHAETGVTLSEDAMHQVGSLFPFYARPFRFFVVNDEQDAMDQGSDSSAFLSEQDSVLQFVVLTYNTALANHAMALANTKNGRCNILLKKALKLYEIAFCVMQEACWDALSSTRPEEFHLLLAVCTNVGFIQSFFRNFPAINLCLEFLNDLMNYCDGEDPSLLETEDYLYFFTTALLFRGRPLDLAPAA